MSWGELAGRWTQLESRLKETWGNLASALRRAADDGDAVVGELEQLGQAIREQAERLPDPAAAGARDRVATLVLRVIPLLGLGMGLVYYLQPGRGRGRRSSIRATVAHALHKVDDTIGDTSRDLVDRLRTTWPGARPMPARLAGEELADELLVEGVRASLGHFVSNPGLLEITAHRGRILLRGAILAGEVGPLLSAVASVPGVVAVEEHLDVLARPRDLASVQGAARRPGEAFEIFQVNWSPTTRVVAGMAGAALITSGASRGGLPGLALGVLGGGLLARGVGNVPLHQLLGPATNHQPAPRQIAPAPAPLDLPPNHATPRFSR